MDPWKEYAAREECRDAVRDWAALEGKTPAMADDLLRRYAEQASHSIDTPLAVVEGARLVAWAIETWWNATRR
jgi:hypothetical protein